MHLFDPLADRGVGEQRRDDPAEHLVGAPLADGGVQLVLVGEVAVEHRLADAGLDGDRRHAHVGTVPVDCAYGGLDQLLATFLPVGVPPGGAAVAGLALLRHGLHGIPMATYIGFLRAINLGPTRKFPKGDIVAATEAAGFTGRGDAHQHRQRPVRHQRCAPGPDRGGPRGGVPRRPGVRGADHRVPHRAELCAIADEADEVADGHPGTHYVSLLKKEPSAALARRVEALSTDRDIARVRGRAVHLVITDPYHHARLTNAEIEKELGVATNRNLKVIRAIADKWCR